MKQSCMYLVAYQRAPGGMVFSHIIQADTAQAAIQMLNNRASIILAVVSITPQ
jgi:hypothetical protein